MVGEMVGEMHMVMAVALLHNITLIGELDDHQSLDWDHSPVKSSPPLIES